MRHSRFAESSKLFTTRMTLVAAEVPLQGRPEESSRHASGAGFVTTSLAKKAARAASSSGLLMSGSSGGALWVDPKLLSAPDSTASAAYSTAFRFGLRKRARLSSTPMLPAAAAEVTTLSMRPVPLPPSVIVEPASAPSRVFLADMMATGAPRLAPVAKVAEIGAPVLAPTVNPIDGAPSELDVVPETPAPS